MADQNVDGSDRRPQPTGPEPVPVDPEPVDIEPILLENEPEPIPVPPEPAEQEEEVIALVEPGESDGESKVRAIGAALQAREQKYERPLNLTGQGATRCRIFHSRIAEAPLEHMQQTINEWLDKEEIEIKHVSQVIGIMEGKTPEPNIIVTVWY